MCGHPTNSKQAAQPHIRTLPTPASPIVSILNRWSYGNAWGGGGGALIVEFKREGIGSGVGKVA